MLNYFFKKALVSSLLKIYSYIWINGELITEVMYFIFLGIHRPDLIAVFLQEIVGHSGDSISNFPFSPLHLLQNRKSKLQLQPDLRTQSYVYSTDF